MNGRTWMDIHSINKGEANDIGATLARLDGTKFYSLLLWKLPPSKSLDDVSPDEDANEYITVRRVGQPDDRGSPAPNGR
jgi:hypothetical protein